MCQTVEFGKGLTYLLAAGEFALAEIGPGQSLGALTRGHPGCPQSQWPLIVRTLPGPADRGGAPAGLAEAVARLWLTGVPIDWPALHGIEQAGEPVEGHLNGRAATHPTAHPTAAPSDWRPGRVPLPTYPFEHQEHWLEAEVSSPAAATIDAEDPVSVLNALPLLADTDWVNVPLWRQTTPRPPGVEATRWLVFTDHGIADTIADTLRRELSAAGAEVVLARPGKEFAVEADGIVLRPGSPQDATAALRHLAELNLAPQRVVHLWTAQSSGAEEATGPDGTGDPDATADAVERGLHTLIAFARAAGDIGLEPWQLDVVSISSHRVLAGDRVRPERATVLGPCRLIPVEYPQVRTRLIDVDTTTVSGAPLALLTELRAEPADQVVALRAGQRWVPGYEVLDASCATDPAAAVRIRPGGSYLVTGGLGGIGLAMAERLAQDYQARLVLLGRTPVPPQDQWAQILATPATAAEVRRRIEGLQRLRHAGAEVITVAGDVSSPEDVQRAVTAAVQRFGGLDGVLHCAGVPATGLMQFKTASDIAKVLAPKVAGTLAIAKAVKELSLDFIALFSSTTSATGGGAGQVDYCAANAYLDAYAQSEPIPGCLVTAIDWGEWVWNGWTTGLENYDEGSRQFFQDYRQKFGVSFDDGWQTLQRVLAARQTHVVISTQDFPTLVSMSRRSSIASHSATVKKARDALGRSPRPELSTAFVEPQSEAEQAIAGVWAEALGLEQVGVHDNFFELGGNSLIGMEIIAEVRKALQIAYLPPHLLYEAPTVAALATSATAGDSTDQQQQQSTQADDQQRSRIEQRRNTLRSRRMP
jgi:NAD(P)-dependent dehydrogenase (short-subunit alcohol dehydrogenase family)